MKLLLKVISFINCYVLLFLIIKTNTIKSVILALIIACFIVENY